MLAAVLCTSGLLKVIPRPWVRPSTPDWAHSQLSFPDQLLLSAPSEVLSGGLWRMAGSWEQS